MVVSPKHIYIYMYCNIWEIHCLIVYLSMYCQKYRVYQAVEYTQADCIFRTTSV